MFHLAVSRPTRPLRQLVDRCNTDTPIRERARILLRNVIDGPLRALLSAGDVILAALLRDIDDPSHHSRLRAALLRLLMYVSDCHRYLYSNARSREAAELMRLVSPSDPEAHMRLALTGVQIACPSAILSHFFHFCSFLANRNVALDHPEAVVVHNFISSCRKAISSSTTNLANGNTGKDGDTDQSVTSAFILRFIDVVWSVITAGEEESKKKVQDQTLWIGLRTAMSDGMPGHNYHHMIAALIFALYRTRPQADETLRIRPERLLVDELVCSVILTMSEFIRQRLSEISADARRRRKNRRRCAQKKRRADGRTATGADENTAVAADVLCVAVDIDGRTPGLGALAFLSSYWAIHRSAPRPWSDLRPMAETLTALRSIVDEMNAIAKLTATEPLVNHVSSKLLAPVGSIDFPALPEDIVLRHFSPCSDHDELKHVVSHDVSLASIVTTSNDNIDTGFANNNGIAEQDSKGGALRNFLSQPGNRTYESVLLVTTNRHLEAFSMQCAKEVPNWTSQADKKQLAKIVSMTMRKVRLMRLIGDLERVHGGTLLHQARVAETVALTTGKAANAVEDIARGGEEDDAAVGVQDQIAVADQIVEDNEDGTKNGEPPNAPQPAQDPIVNEDSLHEQISCNELERRIRKRRRVQGQFTPGQASNIEVPTTNSLNTHQSLQPNRTMADYQGSRHPRAKCSTGCTLCSGYERLSQGSLQVCFAQRPTHTQEREGKRGESKAESLTMLLTRVLYNSRSILSPPRNTEPRAFWWDSPTDDYPQRVYPKLSLNPPTL